MNLKLIPLEEDIKEKDFIKTIRKYNFRAIKFTIKSKKKIERIISGKNRDFFFDFKFINIGKPDFFIWNEKEYYFCEFKSKNDLLRNEQMNWIVLHEEYPCALAFVKNDLEKIKMEYPHVRDNLYWSESIPEKNNLKKILDWRVFNEILKTFCKENPTIVDGHLFYYKEYDTWFGEIPYELEEILVARGVLSMRDFKLKDKHINYNLNKSTKEQQE